VNYNAPGQLVIAGAAAAVQRAIAACKARGREARAAAAGQRAVPQFSLMRAPPKRMRGRLESLALTRPSIRFVSSVDAREYDDPAAIRELLVRQLASPVRWTTTVKALADGGVTRLVECGPGKVLTGLNRRIDKRPGLEALALEDTATLEAALAAVAGAAT
jgi:[acyl-carrier-protein] S-malonyltransferase